MATIDRNLLQSAPANRKYQTIWRRFKEFVDEERLHGRLPDGQFYLTRQNVDEYFQKVVAHVVHEPNTAKAYRPALQWYADNVEHPDPNASFKVSLGPRSIVEKSLAFQARQYAQSYLTKKYDAHADLPTDVLTRDDHLKVIRHALPTSV
jgi:hypothetical protein